MFCPNCGNPVPEGNNFCTACGARITPPAPAAEPIPGTVQEPVQAPAEPIPEVPAASVPESPAAPVEEASVEEAPIAPIPAEEPPVSETPVPEAQAPEISVPEAPIPAIPAQETQVPETPAPVFPSQETSFSETPAPVFPAQEVQVPAPPIQEPQAPVQPYPVAPYAAAPVAAVPNAGFVPPKQGGGNKKVIIAIVAAAAALLIIIVGAIGLTSLFSSFGGDNAYAYLSDGKYELITNLDKGESIEIASSRSDIAISNLLAFSPDGKYIYYYTKYDPSTGGGSLCRAEYGKLKSDPSKNDKYIETIATNASLGFRFMENGSVVYMNSDDSLYYYNNEEPVRVAKNVSYYLTDGAKRLIYVEYAGDSSMLYGIDLDDVDNKIKLASNFGYISAADDFDNIMYVKVEDDGSQTLYNVGFEKEAEKLGQGVRDVISTGDGKVYFTADNGTKLSLYDYVDDAYADDDAGIIEPREEDFSVPHYNYDMVYGNNLSESDYDELYTSCTRPLYLYGESTWWSYSMEEALERDWGSNTKGLVAATQSFIDRFGDTADEDGYILVTDEVKAALKEIQKNSDDPKNEWQWMWLCYHRYEYGTTTDYEGYQAAYDKWYEAKNRIEMREQLQDKEYDYPVRTLYCYEDGKVTALNENILSSSNYSNGIMFNTTDMVTEKLPIEDVTSAYDVQDLFSIDHEAENYVLVTGTGEICRMSPRAAEIIAEMSENGVYASLYFTDKSVFLFGGEELSMAPISGGTVGDFTLISEDAQVLSVNDDATVYYTTGSYQNNSVTYCDLYSYTDGASTRLARDVVISGGVNVYDDGTILAYTGYREIYGYELSSIDPKGESTIIADNVTQYIRVDKSTLLYISDGDLYLYNGKEKTMVESDVDYLWVKDSMEYETVRNWADGGYGYNP